MNNPSMVKNPQISQSQGRFKKAEPCPAALKPWGPDAAPLAAGDQSWRVTGRAGASAFPGGDPCWERNEERAAALSCSPSPPPRLPQQPFTLVHPAVAEGHGTQKHTDPPSCRDRAEDRPSLYTRKAAS